MSGVQASPHSTLLGLITGYHLSCAVHVAAKIGLAELLAEGPQEPAALAAATAAHAPSLQRVLRLLVSAGVLAEDAEGRFSLTAVGELLRRQNPGSLHAAALLWGGRPQIAWNRLLRCVQTGKPAFNRVFGTGPFQYMSEHTEDARIFDEGMAALTEQTAMAVMALYAFPSASTIIDIGGGNGVFLATILADCPSLRGILFDLAHVVERAAPRLAALGLTDRCRVVAGDFFASVPHHADIYLVANVLTDWEDPHAIKILANCRTAMPDTAKVIVVEPIYPEHVDQSPFSRAATSTDVNVMVCAGGRTRSEAQFQALFQAAGLELTRIVPTTMAASVLEGSPV